MSHTILDAVRSIDCQIYAHQLKGIQDRDIWRKLLEAERIGSLSTDTTVLEIIKAYSAGLPPEARHVAKLEDLTGPDDERLSELLVKLVTGQGREAQRLSHASRRAVRSLFQLGESWKERHFSEFGRLALEFLAGFCVAKDVGNYRKLPLRILIVDNRPEEIATYNELLPVELGFRFWEHVELFLYKAKFGHLLASMRKTSGNRGAALEIELLQVAKGGDFRDPQDWLQACVDVTSIDLILQDHSLGHSTANGIELARAFLETAPQALVFLTTGLPVETLTALENLRGVDRVIRKSDLAALPWYYHLAFRRTMGSLFWESWLSADEREFLARRTTLRSLFGSIRTWLNEPEVLWHGQALPEMVDHGHPHISDLWRLTNEILGARKSSQEPAIGLTHLTTPERVLLALGVWLHDVGHRGDEFCVTPPEIRDVHGSISEKLLLSDPGAFGLGWLLEDPSVPEDQRQGADDAPSKRVHARNALPAEGSLSALRLAGLLCRHHQSSAPLIRADIAKLHSSAKFASDYARVALGPSGESVDGDPLDDWRNDERDLPWTAISLRTLEDFVPHAPAGVDLMKCACLLRFVDAIHLSRCRSGSRERIATHEFYRRNRQRWVDRRIDELNTLLEHSPAGSRPFVAALQERLELLKYRELLEVQDVHLWRQALVDSVSVRLDESSGATPVICVEYRVRHDAFELKRGVSCYLFRESQKLLRGQLREVVQLSERRSVRRSPLRLFFVNLLDDVLRSELYGQCFQFDESSRRFLRLSAAEPVQRPYIHTHLFAPAGLDLAFVVRAPYTQADPLRAETSRRWGLCS